jgi:DNA-directed RNA polymerase I subunit RPA43
MSVEARKRPSEGFSSFKKRRSVAPPKSTNPVDDDGMAQCFHTMSTSMYVSLAPIHLNSPINGIKAQHLDPLIMTYFAKAGGVVLSYSNIQLNPDNLTVDEDDQPITVARIEGSSPFTFLWITVDLLIWKPQIGDVLEGSIYMQTASHLGMLVHDTFNASIKKYNIPQDWSFIPNQQDEITNGEDAKFKSFGHWQDENENKVEGKLKFTIKSIHTSGKVVSVEGTLIKPGAEKDAQPIVRERRSSTQAPPPSGKHMKFDDEPVVSEIPEPKEGDEILPGYIDDEAESEDIVNRDSDDEEEDSD